MVGAYSTNKGHLAGDGVNFRPAAFTLPGPFSYYLF